jgi:hypothetical protein
LSTIPGGPQVSLLGRNRMPRSAGLAEIFGYWFYFCILSNDDG